MNDDTPANDSVPTDIREGETLAAADIGSNTFHLIVARYDNGEPRVIDRLRENIRLAAGVGADGGLDAAYRDKALACLSRFGQRLRGMPDARVRAVATNAVRQLKAPEAFLAPAGIALGHPVEVVSGREEARLIYLGVAHGIPDTPGRRLVIDVGGGSTEFIIGEHLDPLKKESLQVGCVASTLRYFGDGRITHKRWRHAQTGIAVELQQFAAAYRNVGWTEAIGSSGTLRAIDAVLRELGWSETGITRHGIERLREAVIACGQVDAVAFPGLGAERAGIFAGGVVILETAMTVLGIERMRVAETSMREGLLYDMIGRAEHRDPRNASIDALAQRHGVDRAHASRVETSALALFDQVAQAWQLGPGERDWLTWAARVHEIGLAIAHSQHHRHGAYIVGHSDLPGFAHHEQQILAALLRCQRRKPDAAMVRALPERLRIPVARTTAVLRLAILLRRSREPTESPDVVLHADAAQLQIALPETWLRRHPLTAADLEQERGYLKALDIKLHVAAN
jgi:exopolyphosphatase/guanosine-5'-triphosphate,3'-diphosphate pyrophosphatase